MVDKVLHPLCGIIGKSLRGLVLQLECKIPSADKGWLENGDWLKQRNLMCWSIYMDLVTWLKWLDVHVVFGRRAIHMIYISEYEMMIATLSCRAFVAVCVVDISRSGTTKPRCKEPVLKFPWLGSGIKFQNLGIVQDVLQRQMWGAFCVFASSTCHIVTELWYLWKHTYSQQQEVRVLTS